MDTRNVVVLIGRLVKKPEIRYLKDGTPVANFSVAVNRTIRKPDGSFEDSLDGFFDCSLFGGQALTLVNDHDKGTEIQVTGSLRQSKFHPNGDKSRTVSRIEVRAQSVAPVLAAPKSEQSAAPVAAPQAA